MGPLLASVILAVELGGGFGTATATVVSTTGQSVVVELHVEVGLGAESVVAHLLLPGEDPISLPMVPGGDGTHRISTELRRADYRVVFEAVGDASVQSQPVSLSQLGASLLPEPEPPQEEPATGEGIASSWLWLGVAFAAASLSALAFWVLGGEERAGEDQEEVSAGSGPSG